MSRLPTLGVQSVQYNSLFEDLRRTAKSLSRSAKNATSEFSRVELIWGDCSEKPCVSSTELDALREEVVEHLTISYQFFGDNLGSALGHNTLAETNANDFIMILNPDVILAPSTLSELAGCFKVDEVAIVEAKQIPIEHPKDYDRVTGETSWASTCCALVRRDVFMELEGFDSKSFFLYCDDVDFSWRARLLGFKVIYQPAAVVYHDKRISDQGGWVASSAEKYYSAEAALILAHKWSRGDIVEQILAYFDSQDDDVMGRAAAEYRRRNSAGELVQPLDRENKVGEFVHGNYAKHRFAL